MTYKQLREMWFDFFRSHGHTILPSAPIVPENDPSTLFTVAGMQPLVPFLLGERHPAGKRIANIQRCFRTGDIDEVGDESHLTFFEMLGNWSLGDYFKREKVAWSWELLTGKKYLGLDPEKIHVTCFSGDKTAPRDTECADFWVASGIAPERIHYFDKSENWWAMGTGLGPQGPCSEMFFCDRANCRGVDCNPAKNCGCFTELGNDVYMQYVGEKSGEGVKISPAKQRNVDTGWGLERVLCFMNGLKSVYETELFAPAIKIIHTGGVENDRNARIIADHIRASCVIISDGVVPSNTGAGYVLRRLIRRAVRVCKGAKSAQVFTDLVKFYNTYLEFDGERVTCELLNEVEKFETTIQKGLREFERAVTEHGKGAQFSGATAFFLYETYGFPIELTAEMARERGMTVNMNEYDTAKTAHSNKSRDASATAGVFRGGLAGGGEMETKFHTLQHILLGVLRARFGSGVMQKGSNITPERLRFDFSFARKIEPNEIAEIEGAVNEIIGRNLAVTCQEMPLKKAREIGALGAFGDKYGEIVKVYTIGSGSGAVSCEICGGPHVANTREIGKCKIQKEESVGAGVRRIKAIIV